MLILVLRTDKPEAEIGLYQNEVCLEYKTWEAHRQLAETLNTNIVDLLRANDTYLHNLQAILVYKGPGSFTGLRIGMSVANALAYALHIPIVSTSDKNWLQAGIQQLTAHQDEKIALPHYGADPRITKPRK